MGAGGVSDEQSLCRVDDLPDGAARGLLREGNDDQVFAVRQGFEVFVWRNDCPHNHRPLEYRQDQFLSADGQHIVCYAHGAHFEIRTGYCFAGPCEGRSLVPVATHIIDGVVWMAAELREIR